MIAAIRMYLSITFVVAYFWAIATLEGVGIGAIGFGIVLGALCKAWVVAAEVTATATIKKDELAEALVKIDDFYKSNPNRKRG